MNFFPSFVLIILPKLMGVEMSTQEVEHVLPTPFLPTPNLLLSMLASILEPPIIPMCT